LSEFPTSSNRRQKRKSNSTTHPPYFSISSSAGTILFNDFVQNPSTYISSVGMYNDNNELLAVAKLSKPLKKDFTKEALVRVKLDF
jgi:hypothetical protein